MKARGAPDIMSTPTSITIRIRRWAEYKGRKDVEHNSWFRCSNRLLEDPDFFEFSHEEILVWVYILSVSSQKNSDLVTIKFAHAERVCRLRRAAVLSAIEKLSGNQIDPVDDTPTERPRNADDTETCATDKQTNRQTNTVTRPESAGFDFESVYQGYPRKRGKDEGMKRLKARIKTQADFDAFSSAVRKYASECRMERRDPKYMLHWSSFVGTDDKEPWRDYALESPPQPRLAVVPEGPPPEPPPPVDPAERARKAAEVRAMMNKAGNLGRTPLEG
jgi:hypothetical protein